MTKRGANLSSRILLRGGTKSPTNAESANRTTFSLRSSIFTIFRFPSEESSKIADFSVLGTFPPKWRSKNAICRIA